MFRLQVHMLRISRHEIKFKQKIMRHPFIDKIADTAIIELSNTLHSECSSLT